MITLVGGEFQTPEGLPVSNGSILFELNVDATIINTPFGIIPGNAGSPVTFQLDADGNILPNAPAAAAQLYSNAELQPQNSKGLGTFYRVAIYDQNGARMNVSSPMAWQFTQAAGSTVDISNMVQYATVGGNVIFYPILGQNGIDIPAGTAFTINGDTGLSRISAGVWAAGDGTPGDVSGTIEAKNFIGGINNTLVVDGVQYTTIAQAVAALTSMSAGGTVVCPDGYRETITSTITLGVNNTCAVLLKLGMNVLLTVNITDGSDAFVVNSGSGIVGSVPFSNPSRSNGSVIQLAGTANVANIVHAKPLSGGNFTRLERFQVDGAGSGGTSVVSNAHIWIDDLFDQGIIKDVAITQIAVNSIGWLVSGTNTTNGPFILDGCWATGDSNAGARPLVIKTLAGHGAHAVKIQGGGYVGPGNGFPAIEANGEGNVNNIINTIEFDSVYMEDFTNAPATAMKLVDVSNVTVLNCTCGLTGNAASVGIDISQSTAGLTRGIQVIGFYPGSSACIGISNHITGETIGTSTVVIPQYFFGQADPSGVRATLGPIFSNPQSLQIGQYKQAANNLADLVIIPAFPASRKPLTVRNFSDNTMNVDFDSGSTTTQETHLRFLDQGTAEWELRKSNGNGFSIQDIPNNFVMFSLIQNGNIGINAGAGTNAVTINQLINSGTNGLVVYSGGATPIPVASITASFGLNISNAAGTETTTILSPNGNATFRNFDDSSIGMAIDSGASATQEVGIFLRDQGVSQWRVRKTSSNFFAVEDDVNSVNRISFGQVSAIGAAGVLRLANTETINWRNAGNSADLTIGFTAGNVLATSGVTGFGNGSAGTAVTTTTKGTGSGPAAPQTVVGYEEVVINGTTYYRALFQ